MLIKKPSWNLSSKTICLINKSIWLWLVPMAIYIFPFLHFMLTDCVDLVKIPEFHSQRPSSVDMNIPRAITSLGEIAF
jgi:hypothetical protein